MTTTTNKTINKANVASSSPFSFPNNNNTREEREEEKKLKLERKIAIATEGLLDYIVKRLRSLEGKETTTTATSPSPSIAVVSAAAIGRQNIEIICNYLIAMNAEINPAIMSRRNLLVVLCYLSEFHHNKKLFSKMTRDNVLAYLDSLRKPEASDPQHQWIGTYNLRRIYFLRFFKWLYNPDLEPKNRPTPEVMTNIHKLKRLEQSTIKPTDLWTAEDDILFLKYCPSKRDKAYYTIAKDSSCRPDEILKLRIRDVVFKTSGTSQYAEIVVNGKTGNRSIPLFSAVPYIKDWIDDHPQGRNPNAFLIPSLDRQHRKFGNKMQEKSLNNIYKRYKHEFFPALLQDFKVVTEDKQKICDLLKKPWNPYIFRHSALTAKSKILREHTLRQHAGWTGKSQMHMKYLHYFGNESNENLLAEYGIVTEATKGNVLLPDSLKPKQCPNCSESNIPASKFCAKCRMVLTYDAYEELQEEQKKKDKRLEDLEKSLQAQLQIQQNQQKILETIWNNMVSAASTEDVKKKNNQHYNDADNDDENNIHVSKLSLTWQKRGVEEEKEPPPITTAAETFVLADGKDNKLAKDMSPEEIGRLPWRTLVSREELRKRLSS
jgi:integrase/recombinase XerD